LASDGQRSDAERPWLGQQHAKDNSAQDQDDRTDDPAIFGSDLDKSKRI